MSQIVTGELHFYQLLAFLKENLRFPLFDCDTPCIRLISGGVAISEGHLFPFGLAAPLSPSSPTMLYSELTFKVILYHSVSLLHKQKHTNAQTQTQKRTNKNTHIKAPKCHLTLPAPLSLPLSHLLDILLNTNNEESLVIFPDNLTSSSKSRISNHVAFHYLSPTIRKENLWRALIFKWKFMNLRWFHEWDLEQGWIAVLGSCLQSKHLKVGSKTPEQETVISLTPWRTSRP